jgi:hypothetical protein
MAGSSRLGFRPGRTYHNAVLATMYIAVFVVIAGLVIANVFLPLFSSPSSSQPAKNGAGSVATSTPASGESEAPRPTQTQSSSHTTSDSISVSSSGDGSQPRFSTTPTDKKFEDTFKNYIRDNTNITIVSMETQGGVVHIEWIPHNMTTTAAMEDLTHIAGFYSGITQTWDVEKLDATILNSNHQPETSFHVQTQWADQYRQKEITDQEFLTQITKTMNETPFNENISQTE